eukprot:11111018-Ditylum_brightwellii.AAC.1
MEATEADIFGCAKTNIAWNPQLMHDAKRHIRSTFRKVHSAVSSSLEFQIGGTMVAAVGKTIGRVIDSGADN